MMGDVRKIECDSLHHNEIVIYTAGPICSAEYVDI